MKTILMTLVAATLLCLSTIDASSNQPIKESFIPIKPDTRTARKYTELDDLNTFESSVSATSYMGSTEADSLDDQKSKELIKRDTNDSKKAQKGQPVKQNSPKKQKPGFFWTIAKVTYETFNETKSAVQQIGQLVSNNFPAAPPKRKPVSANQKKKPSAEKSVTVSSSNQAAGLTSVTTEEPTTTTKFTITRPELQSLVRRNVKGLVRLFNIEWKDAMKESQQSIREFRNDLGKQIGVYLQDNPKNY